MKRLQFEFGVLTMLIVLGLAIWLYSLIAPSLDGG
jgi:hypothetical protein